MSDAVLASALRVLGFVALRPRAPGAFEPVSTWPASLEAVLSLRHGVLDLEASPFLDAFVVDAARWWDAPEGEHLRSGSWSQADATGGEKHLEAWAVRIDGAPWLLLHELGEDFELNRQLLQARRETKLLEVAAAKEQQRREVALHCILHDLANPMTAVFGALQLLSEAPLSDRLRPVLAVANLALERQKQLLSQVVEVYRAEAEGIADVPESAARAPRVGEVVTSVHAQMEAAFGAAGKSLRLDLDLGDDAPIVGERSRLERVLFNLLENALRHTPEDGTVTLGARPRGAGVMVWVDDEGPGISEEDGPLVFDRMHQGAQPGASGLGLYFCRITIERWGGMIGHLPRTPIGTRFWFQLPHFEEPARDPGDEDTEIPPVFSGMVGRAEGMLVLRHRIGRAAQTDVTVLLTGESGTGKELAARAIHDLSDRRDGPFVPVNCGGVSESLLESELFGHVRGAFTGAARDRKGMLQLADRGTLFLDEIEAASPAFQTQLLRALEAGEVRRVGDEKTLSVDVRVVAASNRDLKAMVESGEMREDFYYRINVFNIHLPPLRERSEDIPLLVRAFAQQFAKRHGRAVGGVSAEALARFMAFDWPGNIRQLRNAVEHAVVAFDGDQIEVADLPDEIATSDVAPLPGTDEKTRILAALERTGGNRTAASALLGYSRVTLWKKMKKLGLDDGETA